MSKLLFLLFGVQFWCSDFSLSRFILLDGIVHFTTMNRYLFRGFHPQAYLVAANFNDNDRNVIINDNTFVFLS